MLGNYFNTDTEIIFLLLGSMLGVLFGLDAWRGTTDDNLPFYKSPRARSFIWVVITVASAFLSKLVFEEVAKPRVLVIYLSAFAAGAAIVVVGIGIWIVGKFAYIKYFEPQNYPPHPFSVMDYFVYGYSFVRKAHEKGLQQLEEENRKRRNEFLPGYGKQVGIAIAGVSSYSANPTEAKRDENIKTILSSICAVVSLYHAGKRDVEFNANLMIAYHKDSAPEGIKKKARFTWGDIQRYEYFLALNTYAYDRGRQDFSLPVEDNDDPQALTCVLPGAPEAFFMNETVIIDYSKKFDYPPGVPVHVQAQISRYFKARKFESFACLNVLHGGERVGVVNVEANIRNIFGKGQANKQELEALLYPFCFLLGFLIKG